MHDTIVGPADWLKAGTALAILFLFFAAVLASTTSAAANTFTTSDAAPFSDLQRRIIQLSIDSRQTEAAKIQSNDFNLDESDCLRELHDAALAPTSNDLADTYVLINLSAQMRDAMDEATVNKIILWRSKLWFKHSFDYQSALRQTGSCSKNTVVNTYAQKAAALINEATVLFSLINHKLSPH